MFQKGAIQFILKELEKNDVKIISLRSNLVLTMTVFMLCSLETRLLFYSFMNILTKRHFNFVLDENVKVKKDEYNCTDSCVLA